MSIGILVVDDSNYMRSRIKSALDDDEFQIVAEAANGAEAVRLYKEQDHRVDLILMDIVMKKANGVKATAALKKKLHADVAIVMVTSVGQRKKMRLAADAGADGYVTKPFDDDNLRRAIMEVLDRQEAQADPPQ